MPQEPEFDLAAAHRYFAVHCFNSSWKLIDKEQRSPEEDQELVALGQASLWHWTQRPDCTDKNLSVGHWLLSRIYMLTAEPDRARRHAEVCRGISEREGVAPFYLGFAYEALARAASAQGNATETVQFLTRAREIGEGLEKPDDRKTLLDDLATIHLP